MVTLLEARSIWKSLGGRIVLRGASLSVAPKERVVLAGDNGSGKSTLLHVLCGVLDPDEGEVVLREGATIGFAPERPDLPEHLLAGEWLDVVASLKRVPARERDDHAMFGVGSLRNKANKALSLGQRQRVSLASAFLGRPSVLVLDEPTNALDASTRSELVERLVASDAAVLVATHDRELARELAARVVEIRGGRL